MDTEEVFDKVKSIIVEQLGVAENSVTKEASFIDDLGADSLDVVDIVQGIEDEFGISLQDQAIPNNLTIAGLSQIVFNRINPNKA